MKKKSRMFLLVLVSFFLFAGCEAENEVVAEKPEMTAKERSENLKKRSEYLAKVYPEYFVKKPWLWTKQKISAMKEGCDYMDKVRLCKVVLQKKPPFYQGQMPIEYLSIGSGTTAMLHNFGTWRNLFYWREIDNGFRMSYVLDGAIAIDNKTNTLVAECKVTRQITEDRLIGLVEFELEEIHYDLQGRKIFSGTFEVNPFSGFKTEEIGTEGAKEKEYFFVFPIGSSAISYHDS